MFESKKTLKAKIAELEKEVAFYKREVRDAEARLDNAKGYIHDIQDELKSSKSDNKGMMTANKLLRDEVFKLRSQVRETKRADVVYACFKTLLEMGLEIRNKKASIPEQYEAKCDSLKERTAALEQELRGKNHNGFGLFTLPNNSTLRGFFG